MDSSLGEGGQGVRTIRLIAEENVEKLNKLRAMSRENELKGRGPVLTESEIQELVAYAKRKTQASRKFKVGPEFKIDPVLMAKLFPHLNPEPITIRLPKIKPEPEFKIDPVLMAKLFPHLNPEPITIRRPEIKLNPITNSLLYFDPKFVAYSHIENRDLIRNVSLYKLIPAHTKSTVPSLLNTLPKNEPQYNRTFHDRQFNWAALRDIKRSQDLEKLPFHATSYANKIATFASSMERCKGSKVVFILGHVVNHERKQMIVLTDGSKVSVNDATCLATIYGLRPIFVTCESVTLGTGKIDIQTAYTACKKTIEKASDDDNYSYEDMVNSIVSEINRSRWRNVAKITISAGGASAVLIAGVADNTSAPSTSELVDDDKEDEEEDQ